MKTLVAIVVCVLCGYGMVKGTVKSLSDSVSKTAVALKVKG